MERNPRKSQVAMADTKRKPGRKRIEEIVCFWCEKLGLRSTSPAMVFKDFPVCRKCKGY